MLKIDGAFGEGGGQVLRTALGLSLVTGKGFRIENIRAGRKKPGLMRQHLTAVQAAAEISGAEVDGAEMRSMQLTFVPGRVKPGSYRFAVGTAGSATLVFQTVLPGLLTGGGASELIFEGGTHNPMAPPYDFLAEAFLPLLKEMGAVLETRLTAYGFYPAGGGRFEVKVTGVDALKPLRLVERGEIRETRCVCLASKLPQRITRAEAEIVSREMGLPPEHCKAVHVNSCGPGNVVMLKVTGQQVTEVITTFGERGRPLRQVAREAVDKTRVYLGKNVVAGQYLADQLLAPMAIAGGGRFLTMEPSLHTKTNIEVIKRFLDIDILCRAINEEQYEIIVEGGQP
jgi:RNA 3'-terminal phosphate cyclase (ATP)